MNTRIVSGCLLALMAMFFGLMTLLPNVKGGAATSTNPDSAASRRPDLPPMPVLVELFTSEGCSDCPPADALLRRLGRTQPVHGAAVMVIEEHVNYWDRLGWKDPFFSEWATTRQGEYARAFGGEQVYTPQMVVDGDAQFVGSSEGDAVRAIRTASQVPKPAVHLSWTESGKLAIQVDPLTNAQPGDATQIYIAITEDMLRSDVKRGENEGRALEHDGVARQIIAAGKAGPGSAGFSSAADISISREWNRANLRAVVFAQEQHSRRILAASAIAFSAP